MPVLKIMSAWKVHVLPSKRHQYRKMYCKYIPVMSTVRKYGNQRISLVEHGHDSFFDDPDMQGTHLDGGIAVRCMERGHH
jgi:hypothetical protein